jgi:thiol-disulfide isomerase/thioredoxin
MKNIILIFAIILVIYYIYNYYNNDNDSLRKTINKKYDESKKIHTSEQFENKINKNKLVKKLNKISEEFNKIEYKHTIKLFFADWCPHCVDFKPIWNSLKNKYNTIKFIEIDCSENNPNLPYVQGFPTIAIFDKNNNYIESYEDERTFNMFEKYIKSIL